MPKFAANLSMLFGEHEFLDRFEAAAQSGFTAVECQFPYVAPKEEIADRLARHGLTQVLINLPAGDWANGDRGIACDPARVAEFQEGVDTGIAYAKALGCKTMNCLAGIKPTGISRETAFKTMAANVAFAAEALKQEGILLVIEAINSFDVPGFFVNTSAEAIALLDAAGSDNAKLQYDVYHMQRMEGDLANTLTRLLPRIGHIQIADVPGRHEPGTGDIDFPSLFRHLDRLGYTGWIGCEYSPKTSTREGLRWLDDT
jgi:hydroxypyruvate isomerase